MWGIVFFFEISSKFANERSINMVSIALGLLIPLMGTILGSAFVFMMKKGMSDHLQKSLLGFASGVMVAASVWSLIIPSIEMCEDMGKWSVLPAAIGLLLGMSFLLLPRKKRLTSCRYSLASKIGIVSKRHCMEKQTHQRTMMKEKIS